MVRRAMYTVLMGKYEKLSPLPEIARAGIDAFCFSDDPALTSDSWQVVYVEPEFPLDSVRSQRLIKILGHPVLSSYEETLFIDGSVRLKVNPAEILDAWLSDTDLALPEHSFRDTVEEEFAEVLVGKLDSRERVTEQLDHYRKLFPGALSARPLWTAIMARRKTPALDAFTRIWADHTLRYSRRDQLSVNVAIELSGVSVVAIPLDNHESELHTWPVRTGLKKSIRKTDMVDYHEKYTYSQLEVDHYKSKLEHTWNSLSWRLTKPLRWGGRRR
jgi:hypothetical protein